MKSILTSIALISSMLLLSAQSSSDVGKIALTVVIPDNVEGMDVSQLSKLQTKITQIVTATGLAASGYNNNFAIYPKLSIYESSTVESGMQDITIVSCELTLFVKQVTNNVVFSTITKPLKGNGKSKSLALTNALSKINVNDADFQSFITNAKSKILNYYESKCSDILLEANALLNKEQFDAAIGLLMTVPQEATGCYAQAQQKSIEAYNVYKEKQCQLLLVKARAEFDKDNYETGIDLIAKMDPTSDCYKASRKEIAKFQEKSCKQSLLRAKTAIASKNYSSASTYLMQINPETSCYTEAKTLIAEVESKITEAEKREWEFKKQQYADNVQLEKQRINAIKEIAVAYYKSQPSTVSYNYIIR